MRQTLMHDILAFQDRRGQFLHSEKSCTVQSCFLTAGAMHNNLIPVPKGSAYMACPAHTPDLQSGCMRSRSRTTKEAIRSLRFQNKNKKARNQTLGHRVHGGRWGSWSLTARQPFHRHSLTGISRSSSGHPSQSYSNRGSREVDLHVDLVSVGGTPVQHSSVCGPVSAAAAFPRPIAGPCVVRKNLGG